MKSLKKLLSYLCATVALVALLLWLTGNQHVLYGLGKTYFIGKSKPDIDDMPYFAVSTVNIGIPTPWPQSAVFNKVAPAAEDLAYLDARESCAFLVIRQDSLLYENYWRGYCDTTRSNSFSMAKSFTGMLTGIAVDDGYIKSLDQPVGDFLDAFSAGQNASLTIRHLLEMSSGIPFGESYNSPFGYMARAYYGKNLEKETLKYSVQTEPGTTWAYEGGNSVLLGLVLCKATGKSPSRYFSEKVWSCIGAEHTGHWNLDHPGGLEKTFSGFYATARDFARVGKLYLHNGSWEGDTLIDPAFVQASITPCRVPDPEGKPCTWYGYHWWLGDYRGETFYSCRGMRGQYIAVLPSRNLIVVRLGHQKETTQGEGHAAKDLLRYLDIAMSLAAQ